MRIVSRLLVVALVVACTFAVALSPADAGLVNCAVAAACGFGSFVAGPIGGPVLGVSMDTNAYISGSVYTYLARVTNDNSADLPLLHLSIQREGATGNWGVVTDLSSAGVAATFASLADTFEVTTSLNANNTVLAFYYQSLVGPGEGWFTATVGQQTGSGTTLTAVPEPGTLMLVGIGAVLSAPWLRRRKKI